MPTLSLSYQHARGPYCMDVYIFGDVNSMLSMRTGLKTGKCKLKQPEDEDSCHSQAEQSARKPVGEQPQPANPDT